MSILGPIIRTEWHGAAWLQILQMDMGGSSNVGSVNPKPDIKDRVTRAARLQILQMHMGGSSNVSNVNLRPDIKDRGAAMVDTVIFGTHV